MVERRPRKFDVCQLESSLICGYSTEYGVPNSQSVRVIQDEAVVIVHYWNGHTCIVEEGVALESVLRAMFLDPALAEFPVGKRLAILCDRPGYVSDSHEFLVTPPTTAANIEALEATQPLVDASQDMLALLSDKYGLREVSAQDENLRLRRFTVAGVDGYLRKVNERPWYVPILCKGRIDSTPELLEFVRQLATSPLCSVFDLGWGGDKVDPDDPYYQPAGRGDRPEAPIGFLEGDS